MKGLHELKDESYIAIAKLIDNNFIGNRNIVVEHFRGNTIVTGYAEGGQCVNCQIKIMAKNNKLLGVYIQNDNINEEGLFRHVYPPTLKKVIDYLKRHDFNYSPELP